MKVIIAGGRTITDIRHLDEAMILADLFGITPTVVISGKARGVDTLGEIWAAKHGIPVVGHAAKWRDSDGTYNARAGHLRNTEMANQADALVALWDGYSTGTKDMISKAERRGLPCYIHTVPLGTV